MHAAETAQDAWAARGFQSRREYLLDWIDVLREMTPDIVRFFNDITSKVYYTDIDRLVMRRLRVFAAR